MSRGHHGDEIQTLDSPGKSPEMESTKNAGLLNKQSASSCEDLIIHAFDERAVITVSVATQTDWSHEEECSQDHKYPDQGTSRASHKNYRSTSERSIPKNMKSELEISPDNEVLDSLSMETPQTPTACQGETEVSLSNLDKIPSSSDSDSSDQSPQTVLDICCEHWQQQRKKPPVTSNQIAKRATQEDPRDPKERPVKSSKIPLKAAAVIAGKNVTDGDPAMRKDQRLKGLEFERSSEHHTPKAAHKQQVSTSRYNGPSDEAEVPLPEIEAVDCGNAFSLNAKHGGQKRTTPLVKHYSNGQTFVVIFPDGSGQVCYPSGQLAVLVSAAPSADRSCVVVLEDKHLDPEIRAIFTSRGRGTCYHNNGGIWVNLTPLGGTYCSNTGDLKKHWSWLDTEHHVHAPPYRPLCLTLSPNLNIRIQSQENICITFTSGARSMRLHVGVKLKPNQGKGLTLPGPDMLQRHLQQKSAEINVLFQNIQSLITYQKTVSPRKVKPRQSLISQMERRRLPMEQQQSAKKTP